jgi:trigger factor
MNMADFTMNIGGFALNATCLFTSYLTYDKILKHLQKTGPGNWTGGLVMASILEKKENNVVVLTIDVSPEDFGEALQRAFRKNVNRFSIPGFRPGKAPLGIVTKYYGEGVLYDDAIEFAGTPAYTAALAEHGLDPVGSPEMDILTIGRSTGLKFTVTVTVKPEVVLGRYSGVEAVMPEFPVGEDDVDKELTRVQERNSRQVPVDGRAIQADDTANIDYEGFIGQVPFEGGKGASYDLRIGSHTFIPGFEEQMIGKISGEESDIEVTFPEDYNSDELKGKTARFHVKVNSVNIRELPVLDDEFAKDVSEFDTLAEYRESLRAKLQESSRHRADGIFEENVIQAVVANAAVEIPPVMIEQEVGHMIEEQKNQMKYQGIELEQYLGYVGQTMESFQAELQQPAASRVKTRLVLEAVAKAENVTASEEEIAAEIERMAAQYGMKAEDLMTRLGERESGFAKDSVVSRKTVEMLTAAAVKTASPPEAQAAVKKPDEANAAKPKKPRKAKADVAKKEEKQEMPEATE